MNDTAGEAFGKGGSGFIVIETCGSEDDEIVVAVTACCFGGRVVEQRIEVGVVDRHERECDASDVCGGDEGDVFCAGAGVDCI